MRVCFALLIGTLACRPHRRSNNSVSYPAKAGPGGGRHIVFLTGDEEYRSEEGLPMLAKILSQRHGFKCTVLFSLDPDGTINPKNTKSLSDPAALDSADAIVMLLRFSNWPDEDMARFEKLLKAGKPIVALRTSTHAFNGFPKGSRWETWNYNNEGGFGKRVLGETWLTHWGKHKIEATRGVIEPVAAEQPAAARRQQHLRRDRRLRGLSAADATILVRGIVLKALTPDARAGRLPEAALDRQGRAGRQRSGDARRVDAHEQERQRHDQSRSSRRRWERRRILENEGLRRLIVNAVYWGLGMDVPQKADVTYVDEYKPSFYGFDGFRKGLHPSDFALGKKVPGEPLPRPGGRVN